MSPLMTLTGHSRDYETERWHSKRHDVKPVSTSTAYT